MELIIAALAAVLILRGLIFTIVRVSGISMQDTLQNGDILFATKIDLIVGRPRRGRIVICRYPGSGRKNFVKRIVGMPGDTIEIKQRITYINGRALDESYITHPSWRKYGPVTLIDDEYFVMGDNRTRSRDSRSVGLITRRQIRATVRARIWPLRTSGRLAARSGYAVRE